MDSAELSKSNILKGPDTTVDQSSLYEREQFNSVSGENSVELDLRERLQRDSAPARDKKGNFPYWNSQQ